MRHSRVFAFVCLIIVLAFSALGSAQVAVSPFVNPQIHLFDNNGKPLSGGKVFFYQAGTSTPAATYTDSTGTQLNPNPVILDSAGRASIWMAAQAYKIVVQTSLGVQLWSQDNVSGNSLASLTVNGNYTQAQPTAATSSGNQNSFSICQNGSYWGGAASGKDVWCWQDVLGSGSNPASTLTLSHSGSSGTASVSLGSIPFSAGAVTATSVGAGSVGGFILVDGTKYAQTDAGITLAIAAAPDGGTVLLGPGTYTMSASLPITIAKRISIIGAGWATILQVGAGVGATTDVFLLKPSSAATVQGMRFQDFYITPASGTPGRSAFMVDGTNAAVGYVDISHVRVDKLGSYALNIQNASGLTTGTPFTTWIGGESILAGGANLTNAGDNVHIQDTVLTGTGDLTVNLVGGTDGGAHGLLLDNINSTLSGGIVIQNAWQGTIQNSNLEQTVTSTEANNCLIDVQGNVTAPVQNFKIVHNYIGSGSGNTGCGVRVDRAVSTIVKDNLMVQGSVSAATVTANASFTQFWSNRHAPANPISSWLSNSSATTFSDEIDPASQTRQLLGISRLCDASNTCGLAFGNGFARLKGSIGVYGWTTGANDPSTNGATTGISSTGAAVACLGNGQQGDCSGTWNAASYQIAGVGPSGSGALARVTSPALVTPTIGGETITKAPRMTFGGFVSGNITAVQNFQSWIPDQAITITRVTATVATAPVACSPNAVVSAVVIGGATIASATITAGVGNDSGGVTVNEPAGTSIGIRVTTAAAGCGTTPANMNVTVEYQMQ